MKVFDETNECRDREGLEQLQIERLQALIARLRRNVRRYRDLLGDLHIGSLDDVQRLPLTQPDDLLSAFPYGMFALPLREVIRLHSTVGPRGRPLVVGHTRNDLVQWSRLVARQFTAADASDHDVIQICYGAGVPAGGTGYTLGAELIEASVIPEDPTHIDYQLAMLRNYKPTVLITTPSNAQDLAELMADSKIDVQSLGLLTLLLTRPVGPEQRDELQAGLFAQVRCSLGVPEILDPGLCVECSEGRFHVNEDHFLVEEHQGELVVTTLCREAMPLLRYATRIGAALHEEPCECGRTGRTLVPRGRLDGRLLVNERALYEEQIRNVLERTQARGHPFSLQINDRDIVVMLPITNELFADTMRVLQSVQAEIESEFLARLNVRANVQYLSPQDFAERTANPGGANRQTTKTSLDSDAGTI